PLPWAGARAYTNFPELLKQLQPKAAATVDAEPVTDPLQNELERQKRELAEAEARMLEQLRQLDLVQFDQREAEKELADVTSRLKETEQTLITAGQAKTGKDQAVRQVVLSLADLQKRREKLNQE